MRSNKNTFTSSKRVQGFTLVEVLIALVIMSVGMLGIAGLYVHSMQAGRTSMFRHHAVTLAGDVADRIRANPRAIGTYALGPVDNSCVDGGLDCTRDEMAQNDIFVWNQQAQDTLPAGQVIIVFNGGVVPPTYQITIQWNEPDGINPIRTYVIQIPVFPI